jgi:MFS family permease
MCHSSEQSEDGRQALRLNVLYLPVPAELTMLLMQWALIYTAMVSTTFLFSLDNTIVADIQPSIISDFGRIELLPWIGTGYALGSLSVLPWGKAYGIFNIKWAYITGIILFEIGSAICGAAPNMEALIIGRVIAGIGGSGMYSGTLNYISLLTEDKERTIYLAGSTVLWGVGSVLGPVVSNLDAMNTGRCKVLTVV